MHQRGALCGRAGGGPAGADPVHRCRGTLAPTYFKRPHLLQGDLPDTPRWSCRLSTPVPVVKPAYRATRMRLRSRSSHGPRGPARRADRLRGDTVSDRALRPVGREGRPAVGRRRFGPPAAPIWTKPAQRLEERTEVRDASPSGAISRRREGAHRPPAGLRQLRLTTATWPSSCYHPGKSASRLQPSGSAQDTQDEGRTLFSSNESATSSTSRPHGSPAGGGSSGSRQRALRKENIIERSRTASTRCGSPYTRPVTSNWAYMVMPWLGISSRGSP